MQQVMMYYRSVNNGVTWTDVGAAQGITNRVAHW